MTSRNSFFNFLREDRKRRVWTLVMFGLLCFLMTAAFELNLESILNGNWAYNKIQIKIEELTNCGMIAAYLVFAGVGACLYGFQGFAWLTKREQVDFYHSQPIKREKRFQVVYLNGLLMFEVPMLLHMVASGILVAIRGHMSMTVLMNMAINVGIFTIAFLMMYHLVILAMMLTGNIIVSFMVGGTMFVYPSLIKSLLSSFLMEYFDTYASGYSHATSWIGYLSPLERVYRAGNFLIMGNREGFSITLIILAAMAVLMYVAAFFLYKKRASEAAGNALAYPMAGDFIRFLIVIPAGMFFGLMFAAVGVMSSIFWLYFGTVVGVVLAHGFMEVIFHFDIKAAVGKKVQLAVSIALVLGMVSVFCFDIFGYDSYIPEADQVDEISYYINIGEFGSNYHMLTEEGVPIGASDVGLTGENYDNYLYREEYQMAASKTKDVEAVMNLIRAHLAYDENSDSSKFQMIVHYKLKNGQKVYRSYLVAEEVVKEYYKPVYETEQGMNVIYPYLRLSGEKVSEVNVYAPFMRTKAVELTEEEIKELVECYKKDIRSQTIEEMMNAQYIAEANLVYDAKRSCEAEMAAYSSSNTKEINSENSADQITLSLYIASSYENMIRFFEEKNIYLTLPNENYSITEATVYNMYSVEETADHPFWKGREEVVLTEKEIQELLPYMVTEEYAYYGYDKDYVLSVYLTVKNNKTGSLDQSYYTISAAHLPDYMRVGE